MKRFLRWFYDLNITSKLLVAFGATLIALILTNVFALYQMAEVSSKSADINRKWLPSFYRIASMKGVLDNIRLREHRHVMTLLPQRMHETDSLMRVDFQKFEQLLSEYRTQTISSQERKQCDEISTFLQFFKDTHQQLIILSSTEKKDDARVVLNGDLRRLYTRLDDKLSDFAQFTITGSRIAVSQSEQIYSGAIRWVSGVLILATVVVVVVALWIARLVSLPIQALQHAANQVAAGNVQQPVVVMTGDEIGSLASSFNIMVENIRLSMEKIRHLNRTLEQRVQERTLMLESAQEDIRRSEELYRTLITNYPDGAVYLFDRSLRFLIAGGQGLAEFGMSKQSVEEKTLREAFPPILAEITEPLFMNALAGTPTVLEIKYQHNNYVLTTVSVRNNQSEIFAGMMITQNITKRKQAEEALQALNETLEEKVVQRTRELEMLNETLRQSENRFRAIAENYPNGSVQILYKDLRYVYVAGKELIPRSLKQQDFLGKTIGELLSEPAVDIIKPRLEEAFQGDVRTFEVDIDHNTYVMSATPLYAASGAIDQVLLVAQNISERKKYEQEIIRAKEAADAANRAKSEFLANMSHEIRTPMNSILGFAALLREQMLNDQQQNYLDAINASGKTLMQLINDILDLSKIEAGRFDIHYEPFDLHDLVKEISTIFSGRIEEKKLQWLVITDVNPVTALMADEIRLRQILFNLVGNAVKFTDEGFVRLSIKTVQHLDGTAFNEHQMVRLVIEVEDSGIGIPTSQQEEIFEAFRQQEGQSTRKYGGTGLGLTITRRLVEMMDGTIEVQSTVGKGSLFRVTLDNLRAVSPKEMKIDVVEESPPAMRLMFQNPLVLVADDVQLNRELIVGVLSRSNVRIITAINGSNAVEKALAERPDIILMDIRMPGMDGREAATILKTNPQTQTIPIIAITASAMKEDDTSYQMFCDSLLRKPFTKQELLTELQKFLPHSFVQDGGVSTKLRQSAEELLLQWMPDEEVRKGLPQLVQVLNEKFLEQWKTIRRTLNNRQVKVFAAGIEKLGAEYSVPPLQEYGKRLERQVASFDIEKIPHSLEKFSAILRQITQIAGL